MSSSNSGINLKQIDKPDLHSVTKLSYLNEMLVPKVQLLINPILVGLFLWTLSGWVGDYSP